MLINNKIKELLDKILTTHLTRGVQPSEIADAVFEKNYSDVQVTKTNETVCMTVSFLEEGDIEPIPHKMRYTYTPDKYLIRIEQKVNRKSFKVQWDREEAMCSMIDELSADMNRLNSKEDIKSFMNSLPDNLYPKALEKIRLAVA